MKNENILSEMIKYIPFKSTEEEITIEGYPPEKLLPLTFTIYILFGGDQLTAAQI